MFFELFYVPESTRRIKPGSHRLKSKWKQGWITSCQVIPKTFPRILSGWHCLPKLFDGKTGAHENIFEATFFLFSVTKTHNCRANIAFGTLKPKNIGGYCKISRISTIRLLLIFRSSCGLPRIRNPIFIALTLEREIIHRVLALLITLKH